MKTTNGAGRPEGRAERTTAVSAPSAGSVGANRRVIDPVRRDDHGRPHLAARPEPVGRDPAHAYEHAGTERGAADGPAEEGRLRAVVPLGVVEERAVVDRDGTRNR